MITYFENEDRISILEKINRIGELFDPWKMPIELIQHYADTLGYEVGLNKNAIIPTNSDSNFDPVVEQNKQLRFMVSQLPEWYKNKTNKPSIKMMLYSFGLLGDIVYYYTKDYLNNVKSSDDITKYDATTILEAESLLNSHENFKFNTFNWMLANWSTTSLNPDLSNIPDDYFPTPHFVLWYDILKSYSGNTYTTDLTNAANVGSAIQTIKPVNTVFDGILGYMNALATTYVMPLTRIRKYLRLKSSDGRYADELFPAPSSKVWFKLESDLLDTYGGFPFVADSTAIEDLYYETVDSEACIALVPSNTIQHQNELTDIGNGRVIDFMLRSGSYFDLSTGGVSSPTLVAYRGLVGESVSGFVISAVGNINATISQKYAEADLFGDYYEYLDGNFDVRTNGTPAWVRLTFLLEKTGGGFGRIKLYKDGVLVTPDLGYGTVDGYYQYTEAELDAIMFNVLQPFNSNSIDRPYPPIGNFKNFKFDNADIGNYIAS